MRVGGAVFSLSPLLLTNFALSAVSRLREQGDTEPRSQTITWISRNSAVSERPSKMLQANT